MRTGWSGLRLSLWLAIPVIFGPPPTWARGVSAGAHAALEARIVTDSAGCPIAVDLWLLSASDTIRGVEALLRWDRPDLVRFAPLPRLDSAASDTTRDSTVLRRPPKAADGAVINTAGGLLADWEYVEARSGDGLTARITALSSLLQPRHKATPIPPGKTGRLCRLPLSAVAAGSMSRPGDSLSVWIDSAKTRLSNAIGTLFGDLKLRRGVIGLAPCLAGRRGRR